MKNWYPVGGGWGGCWRWWPSLTREDQPLSEGSANYSPPLLFFFLFSLSFFKWRSTRAPQFPSSGQEQSRVAQRAEMTVDERSLTCLTVWARFLDKIPEEIMLMHWSHTHCRNTSANLASLHLDFFLLILLVAYDLRADNCPTPYCPNWHASV